jgi:uncharacterized protein
MPSNLHCPVCARKLQPHPVAGLTIDVCHGGCGGLWFDNFELAKFDEPQDFGGEELLDTPFDPFLKIDYRRRRHCPKCEDMPMHRHFFSRARRVEVDSCPNCGGVWLDCGELARIRHEATDTAEMKRLTHAFALSSAKPLLAEMRAEGGATAKQAATLGRVFKFMGIR